MNTTPFSHTGSAGPHTPFLVERVFLSKGTQRLKEGKMKLWREMGHNEKEMAPAHLFIFTVTSVWSFMLKPIDFPSPLTNTAMERLHDHGSSLLSLSPLSLKNSCCFFVDFTACIPISPISLSPCLYTVLLQTPTFQKKTQTPQK